VPVFRDLRLFPLFILESFAHLFPAFLQSGFLNGHLVADPLLGNVLPGEA